MLELLPDADKRRTLRVLCVGAHCDDIEIGCGATLRTLQRPGRKVAIDWVVLSGTARRRAETERAMRLLVRPACRGDLAFGDFPDGRFPAAYSAIKTFFERLKREPDARSHPVPRAGRSASGSSDRERDGLEHVSGSPDPRIRDPEVGRRPRTAQRLRRRLAHAMRAPRPTPSSGAYPSQSRKHWFTRDTFMAMLRLRGLECRSPSGYAEAFQGRKLRLARG